MCAVDLMWGNNGVHNLTTRLQVQALGTQTQGLASILSPLSVKCVVVEVSLAWHPRSRLSIALIVCELMATRADEWLLADFCLP